MDEHLLPGAGPFQVPQTQPVKFTVIETEAQGTEGLPQGHRVS